MLFSGRLRLFLFVLCSGYAASSALPQTIPANALLNDPPSTNNDTTMSPPNAGAIQIRQDSTSTRRLFWDVFDTQTRLRIEFGATPIQANALASVLYGAKTVITDTMISNPKHDGTIVDQDGVTADQFTHAQAGLKLALKSEPGQHLTWGIAGAAVDGLFNGLFEYGRNKEVVKVEIQDSGWGIVASGSLLPS